MKLSIRTKPLYQKKRVLLLIYPMIKPYPDKIKLFFVVNSFLSRGVPKLHKVKKKPLRKEANSGAGVEVNKKGYRRLQVNTLKKVG